jgi:hypothetical protein
MRIRKIHPAAPPEWVSKNLIRRIRFRIDVSHYNVIPTLTIICEGLGAASMFLPKPEKLFSDAYMISLAHTLNAQWAFCWCD